MLLTLGWSRQLRCRIPDLITLGLNLAPRMRHIRCRSVQKLAAFIPFPQLGMHSEMKVRSYASTAQDLEPRPPSLFASVAGKRWDECLIILSHTEVSGLNAKDTLGLTALHRAAFEGRADVCIALLRRPDFEEVNAKGGLDGWTALHYAAYAGQARICSVLLGHPSFLERDAQDNVGWTALHYAAHAGFADVCIALLADAHCLEAENIDGDSALDLAVKAGHTEIADAIRGYL
eukprot:gnl/TRDRNA2_/TRDRNA2_206802_c0_seq1.p1 gnl/TRDRNA2_/TRDRNA2_206802_c0~~gnl/TRDRNA2_/TRDRNA2_206802_c0_seq1.p1  ORF type:complete len:233 (-),score=21.89 gnl/TRDRNA2_/TRDRNA2_206802_c0_seq1:17-715(-)